MREIKFKVWDKTSKRIWIVESIDWCLQKEITYNIPFHEYKNQCEVVDIENAILMQYTGLQDSKWVDIYEWYIVEIIEDQWHTKKWDKHRVIINDYDIFPFYGDNSDWFTPSEYYKVIWNIYSNPELLNN